jgi:hypothetical protein
MTIISSVPQLDMLNLPFQVHFSGSHLILNILVPKLDMLNLPFQVYFSGSHLILKISFLDLKKYITTSFEKAVLIPPSLGGSCQLVVTYSDCVKSDDFQTLCCIASDTIWGCGCWKRNQSLSYGALHPAA